MKRVWISAISLTFVLSLFVVGCTGGPKTGGEANGGDSFDPNKISQEVHDATLAEVRLFIESLNKTISNKDFEGWKSNLSDARLQEISSADFLQQTSEMPAMKTQKKVLKSAQDYFMEVVVPARGTISRVDDIEFINQNRVKAFTINTKTDARVVLFDLERIGGAWKIIK